MLSNSNFLPTKYSDEPNFLLSDSTNIQIYENLNVEPQYIILLYQYLAPKNSYERRGVNIAVASLTHAIAIYAPTIKSQEGHFIFLPRYIFRGDRQDFLKSFRNPKTLPVKNPANREIDLIYEYAFPTEFLINHYFSLHQVLVEINDSAPVVEAKDGWQIIYSTPELETIVKFLDQCRAPRISEHQNNMETDQGAR